MDNPDKLATLGTQDKGRRQTKQNTQHRKLKRWAAQTPSKTKGEPMCSRSANSSFLL